MTKGVCAYRPAAWCRWRAGSEAAFYDAEADGYHWLVYWENGSVRALDRTRHMYGLAFIMLADSRAHQIGLDGAAALLEKAFAVARTPTCTPARR